ncbi:hypothetical protein [Neptuniibacter sp. QD37_11]|uniref:hypothetical protein n=1 Tax=Neptuniibacter sp. QD37_11 TaxID=3398209 RepID=UPI0039F4DDD3
MATELARKNNSCIHVYTGKENNPLFKTVMPDGQFFEFSVAGFEKSDRYEWLVGVLDGLVNKVADNTEKRVRDEIGGTFTTLMKQMNL